MEIDVAIRKEDTCSPIRTPAVSRDGFGSPADRLGAPFGKGHGAGSDGDIKLKVKSRDRTSGCRDDIAFATFTVRD